MRAPTPAVAAIMAMLAGSQIQAAPQGVYLRCTSASQPSAEHMVVLYHKTAMFDGELFDLGSNRIHYALLAQTVISKITGGPPTLIDIDRLTGDYTISQGVTQTERGHCAKVRPQF